MALSAVLLPTLLFGWVAVRQPLHIDGAMNLQVAQRLGAEGEYARQYEFVQNTPGGDRSPDWTRWHPQEVQTNGPFIVVAAIGLGVLGTSPFALQFANLVFVALLAYAIWLVVGRRWPVAAAVTPLVVLLLLPETFIHSLSGFGEIPALALVVLAFALVAAAVRADDDDTALRCLTGAMFAGGLATVTKTYLVGALPALLVGVALLIVYRPLPPRSALPRCGAYLVPIVLFELYRLLNLGSVSAYASWWGRQGGSIGYQVGVDPSQGGRFEPAARGPIDRVADQVHLLAERAGLPTVLLVALFVGVVALSGVLIVRIIRGRDRSRRLVAVAAVQTMLLTLSSAYLVWWTVLVPEPKTFVRRTYPILLGLYLALVVLAHLVAEHREQQPRSGRDRLRLVPGAVLATVVALLVLTGSVVDARRAVRQDRDRVAGYEQAAAAVSGADPSITFYGTGFFSAPLVSLLAERSFHNLGQVDPCALDPDRSVLVWDEYAQMEFGSPEHAGLEAIDYELEASFAAVSLWRIEPPDSCVDPEPAG